VNVHVDGNGGILIAGIEPCGTRDFSCVSNSGGFGPGGFWGKSIESLQVQRTFTGILKPRKLLDAMLRGDALAELA